MQQVGEDADAARPQRRKTSTVIALTLWCGCASALTGASRTVPRKDGEEHGETGERRLRGCDYGTRCAASSVSLAIMGCLRVMSIPQASYMMLRADG